MPRVVWLNRHIAWLLVIIAWLAVTVPVWVLCVLHDLRILGERADIKSSPVTLSTRFTGGLNELPNYALFALFMVLAYSCGQLCSMLLRSGIVAGFLGVVLTFVAACWTVAMFEMGVNWLVAVAPIPVVLLGVTWLRRRIGSASGRAGGRGLAWDCRWPCRC